MEMMCKPVSPEMGHGLIVKGGTKLVMSHES